MEDSEAETIAETITKAIEIAIEKKALDEKVVLQDSSGARVELSSTRTTIEELQTKAHESFLKLKRPNNNKKLPGVMAWG